MPHADHELLRAYAQHGSEAAFGELVERHTRLVYSAALRQVRSAHLAEEVTQSTFLLLARKAARLSPPVVLSGWLLRSAHFIAMDLLKSEIRRQRREQRAAAMEPEAAPPANPEVDAAWQEIAPALDESLSRLKAADREALALRYFEQKRLEEVAQVMGTSEEAAKKRVARALERLRALLQRRKAVLPATVLAAALTAHAVQAAPPGLSASIAKVVLAKAAAAAACGGFPALLSRWRAPLAGAGALFLALVLVPPVFQAARQLCLRAEQRRLEALLASLQQQQEESSSQLRMLGRQLERASKSLARWEQPATLGAALAGAGQTNALDPRLFVWKEEEDFVRVPKSALDWVGFDGRNTHASVGAETESEPVLETSDGRASPTLLEALGLEPERQEAVQQFLMSNLAGFRQLCQGRSYLTNAQGLDFKGQSYYVRNDASRAWVTPALGAEGQAWREQLRQGLAELMGPDRARILLRQAMDEGSASRCYLRYGAEQLIIAVTPLADARCYYCARRTIDQEVIGGIGMERPVAELLEKYTLPARYGLPPALEAYLRQVSSHSSATP